MERRRAAFLAVISLIALNVPKDAASAAIRPPGYAEAEQAFKVFSSVEQRVRLQVMMIATGYWLAMPTGAFGERLFAAIRRFQTESGYPSTGILDDLQIARLSSMADANYELWGFRKVTHPSRNHAIWIPFGLDLSTVRNQFGLHFVDQQKRIMIDFTTVPGTDISVNFDALLGMMIKENATINYKVLKDGWYVISATTPEGIDHYLRYHQDGANVTGFSLSWNNSNGDVHGERIATLMSASLWSDMIGPWLIDPPVPEPRAPVSRPQSSVAEGVVAKPEPPPAPPPSPAPEKSTMVQTGTGFFVASDGSFLTNAHVINGCVDIRVKTDDGKISDAKIAAVDAANDLAVLRLDKKPLKFVSFRLGARLGEAVEAFGFPHSDILSTSGNFTVGNITAMAGMGDDSRYLQFSAPVQAGNSGGPLLDQSGNAVGIVTAKLNALKVALNDGDLPQNVNFAVKASIIAAFLESNRVEMQTGSIATKPIDPPDIAEQARAISGFVACRSST